MQTKRVTFGGYGLPALLVAPQLAVTLVFFVWPASQALYQSVLRVPGAVTGFAVLLRSRTFLRSGMGFGGCFTDLGLLDGEFHEQVVQTLLASPRRMDGMARYLRGLAWGPVDALEQAHARLAMPVELIWGADDPTFPIAQARRMVKQFPDARLVEIPSTPAGARGEAGGRGARRARVPRPKSPRRRPAGRRRDPWSGSQAAGRECSGRQATNCAMPGRLSVRAGRLASPSAIAAADSA
jgi:hypothetical protein